ncbi:MAG TPA: 3'-5' exonuclease [Bacteriovoracaceae bacterium]|nr:3'-5' exonuclease [Bacteriovoracaceae bacterium]
MSEKNFSTSGELLQSLKFCVIDLETTGGNPETEKIIEIGMVKIENRRIVEERSFLINPEKEIPDFVQKLTGIRKADVSHSPRIEEVIDEIIGYIGTDILVAHNTSFDVPFLNGVLKKLQKPTLDNKVICTNIMTKYMIPDIMSSNLNYMSQIFGISHSQAHRAIEDARATAMLLLRYMDIFESKNIRKVNQLYYPRNKFELDRAIVESHEGVDKVLSILKGIEKPCILTIKGDNGVILTILPVQSPKDEVADLETYLKEFRWSQMHIRLCGPFIEGLFFMNSNFIKIPEVYRKKTVEYLKSKHVLPPAPRLIDEHDFVITPHLISGQFIIYSFLNFSAYSQLIFKFPSHKKKLHQFLSGQVSRFEVQQKGKKKVFIQNDIKEIFLSLFHHALISEPGLYLSLRNSDIKDEKKAYLTRLENLADTEVDRYEFPTKHL